MEQKELYSVREYAEIMHISQAAVYKRLSTTLEKYITVENGRKYLKAEVFKQTPPPEVENRVEQSYKPVEPIWQDMLNTLRTELEAKNQHITALEEENRELRQHLLEQSKRLTELLEQSNKLNQNNQVLIARQQEMQGKPRWWQRLLPQKKSTEPIEVPMEERG